MTEIKKTPTPVAAGNEGKSIAERSISQPIEYALTSAGWASHEPAPYALTVLGWAAT